MNTFPKLEIQQTWRERRIIPSVLIAMTFCGTIFGALSLITIVSNIASNSEKKTTPPLVAEHKPQKPKEPEPLLKPIPLNIISATNSPTSLRFTPRSTQSTQTKNVTLSYPAVSALSELPLEELEFENPFKKRSTTTSKSVKRSNPSKAVKAKNSLAKTITKEASLITRSTPNYPRSARRKGLEGRVVITITIGPGGEILGSCISKSCGHPALDNSALAAARKYRFSPAINGLGQGVPVKRAIPFNFQITG